MTTTSPPTVPPPGQVHYTPHLHFTSRRSPFLCRHGAVSSSQSLATQIGLDILKGGGNAADACIAVAAALNVTEPTSTGLGGDCFALWYDAKTKKVEGLNGSGRAPAALNPSTLPPSHHDGRSIYPTSVHTVTIPGAAAGWVDTLDKWGTLPLADVLTPAIQLATEGFPVHPVTAHYWAQQVPLLSRHPGGAQLLIEGRAPRAGEVFRNPNLANTMQLLGEKGKEGFYKGKVADAIVEVLKGEGGLHVHDDLTSHVSTFPTPITVKYKGVDVWEIPPSGQGLTALLALNILSQLDPPLSSHSIHSADHLHCLIEALRLAFADTRWYVADSDHTHVPVDALLSVGYAKERAALINRAKATVDHVYGSPVVGTDTVSFCAVDVWGNACSFINSKSGKPHLHTTPLLAASRLPALTSLLFLCS